MQIGTSPEAIQKVATYDVVITASNPELLLKPGMTATIKIVVARRDDVLRAPDQALRYSPAGRAAASGSSRRQDGAGWLAAGLDPARGTADRGPSSTRSPCRRLHGNCQRRPEAR